MSVRNPFVVRGGPPPGRMWLGGVRHDGGPWWRLWLANARRYRTRQGAAAAAAWCGGTVEERG